VPGPTVLGSWQLGCPPRHGSLSVASDLVTKRWSSRSRRSMSQVLHRIGEAAPPFDGVTDDGDSRPTSDAVGSADRIASSNQRNLGSERAVCDPVHD
jgi:hypothetical protein